MLLPKPVSGELFDLEELYPKLLKSSASQIRWFGCLNPKDCGPDVLTLYISRLVETKLAAFVAKKIWLGFPDTDSQLPVFKNRLKLTLLRESSRCQTCRYKKFCPIKEMLGAEDDDGPRIKSAVIIEASNPEESYEAVELIESILAAVPPESIEDFMKIAMKEFTAKEVAEAKGVLPSTIRKRQQYLRNRIKRLLGETLFRKDEK